MGARQRSPVHRPACLQKPPQNGRQGVHSFLDRLSRGAPSHALPEYVLETFAAVMPTHEELVGLLDCLAALPWKRCYDLPKSKVTTLTSSRVCCFWACRATALAALSALPSSAGASVAACIALWCQDGAQLSDEMS